MFHSILILGNFINLDQGSENTDSSASLKKLENLNVGNKNETILLKACTVGNVRDGQYGQYQMINLKDISGEKTMIFASGKNLSFFEPTMIYQFSNLVVKVEDGLRKTRISSLTKISQVTKDPALKEFEKVSVADYVTETEIIGVDNFVTYTSCCICKKKLTEPVEIECSHCKANLTDNSPIQDFRTHLYIEAEEEGECEVRAILAFSRMFGFDDNSEEIAKKAVERYVGEKFLIQYNVNKRKDEGKKEFMLYEISKI